MQDGLYFGNTWVAEVEAAVTKQANDLTSPANLNATYTNLFTIPDTTAIRSLLQNAEQIDAEDPDPYRLIPAFILADGEYIFTGLATLTSFQAGWKVSLRAAAKSLFDQLQAIKLADLDLSRYNHKWTLDVVDSFAGKMQGIVYPAIDHGSVSAGVFAQDTITPAIYVKTLIAEMLHRFGYYAVGDWLNDALLNRIVVPFVEGEPQSHDDDWRAARYARVTVTGEFPIPPFSTFDGILQFNRDDEPLSFLQDGSQDNFKADRCMYICDTSMRLHVQAAQNFLIIVDFGAYEALFQVLKNGIVAAQSQQSYGGPYNKSGARTEVFKLDEYVDCQAGDQIQIRFILRKQTTIAQGQHIGFLREGDTWASFEPDLSIRNGDSWIVANNLPDITCAELLKSIALMCSATFDIDETAKTVELKTLDSVINNVVNAQDLSYCIEEGTEPENAVILDPYGQRNLLKWKAQEDKTLTGYGDGVIKCAAQNIPDETTLFELPFAAVVDSDQTLTGYGHLPLIKTRIVTGSGKDLKFEKKDTPACLLLVEPTKMVTVTVDEVQPDLTTKPKSIQLMAAWWHSQPEGAKTSTNLCGLGFDRPPGVRTYEQTLIQRYFGGLGRVLRRPRQFTPSMYLRPADFASLDLYAPVRLRGVRCGSLDINDSFFYVNKVNQFLPGRTCTISLIPF